MVKTFIALCHMSVKEFVVEFCYEKIIIKNENTTSTNVKEKLKKDGEKEKQEGAR